MSAHEPSDTMIEELRRANPVPMAAVEGRRSLPSAHALFAEIVAQPPRRVGRRTRRRVLFVVIAIALIALLVAGFMVVRRDEAKVPLSAACYASASLNSRRLIVPADTNPARACAGFWSDGTFAKHDVPHFDVCVLPSGVPAVFPGESGSVCDRLRLSEYRASPHDISGFAAAVNGRVAGKCMGASAAERIVKAALVKFRLDGWTIAHDPRPFTAATPCASLYVDPPARRVTIIPIIDVRAGGAPTTG